MDTSPTHAAMAPTHGPWARWLTALRARVRLRARPASPAPDLSLASLTEPLSLVTDLEPLADGQLARLRSAIGAERTVLLLAEENGGPFLPAAQRGCDGDAVASLRWARQSRLVRWLVVNETGLDLRDTPQVRAYLSDAETAALHRLGIDAVHPVASMHHLVGLLLLGGLRPGSGHEDILRPVLPLFGLALHNALLLRQSRQRVRHLYRTERLATLGELAAGAAHEIRNPLTSIRSTIQYLRRDHTDGSDNALLMDDLVGEVDRINGIVAGLLTFARPAEPVLGDLDLTDLLQQVGRLIDSAAASGGVEICLPQTPALAHGDADQLKQVFLNLCMNGLQAMPDGGRLILEVTEQQDTVLVEVCDTGTGIAADALDRVFDPFYTTREGGTGLGLAVCFGIVTRHKGQIDLDSEPGAGTRVRVRLPAPEAR